MKRLSLHSNGLNIYCYFHNIVFITLKGTASPH